MYACDDMKNVDKIVTTSVPLSKITSVSKNYAESITTHIAVNFVINFKITALYSEL